MKTKFISNFKQFLLLLVAFLGTFVSYSQQPQDSSIGGKKTPTTDPSGGLIFNIGVSSVSPQGNSGELIVLSPTTKMQFAYWQGIGGGGKGINTGQDIGQLDNDSFGLYNIGGKITEEYTQSDDVGGRDSGGGLNPINDIGGRNDTGTGAIFNTGRSTPGGIGYVDKELCNLSKIEKFGCVLRPTYTPG